MICPACGYLNLPGADWCQWCQFDLMAIDLPAPTDRVDRSLMLDPVAVLCPHPPVCIAEEATLGEATEMMIAEKVGAVLVVNTDGRLVGILTERDFLTKIAGTTEDYGDWPLRDYMTRDPETVNADDPLALALGKMAVGGYRHLPVVEKGKPIGSISVRGILSHIVAICQD
jgi:CBS domain-containing protein